MQLLNLTQVKVKLNIKTNRTVYKLIEQGKFPEPVLLGSVKRWIEDEVDQAIERLCNEIRTAKNS